MKEATLILRESILKCIEKETSRLSWSPTIENLDLCEKQLSGL